MLPEATALAFLCLDEVCLNFLAYIYIIQLKLGFIQRQIEIPGRIFLNENLILGLIMFVYRYCTIRM